MLSEAEKRSSKFCLSPLSEAESKIHHDFSLRVRVPERGDRSRVRGVPGLGHPGEAPQETWGRNNSRTFQQPGRRG